MNYKTLERKIDFLNELTGGTLSISHYCTWCLSSYGIDSPFLFDGPVGHVRAPSFRECINRAFRAAGEVLRNG